LPLFTTPAPSPVELRLSELRPDELSPREALQVLYELHHSAVEAMRRA
jgi:hypothetical protein